MGTVRLDDGTVIVLTHVVAVKPTAELGVHRWVICTVDGDEHGCSLEEASRVRALLDGYVDSQQRAGN